jgi:hypothetical protein
MARPQHFVFPGDEHGFGQALAGQAANQHANAGIQAAQQVDLFQRAPALARAGGAFEQNFRLFRIEEIAHGPARGIGGFLRRGTAGDPFHSGRGDGDH